MTARRGRVYAATCSAIGAVLLGILLLGSEQASAVPTAVEYGVTGPVGLTIGQGAVTTLFLPAVQAAREIPVELTFSDAARERVLDSVREVLSPRNPAVLLELEIDSDGRIILNDQVLDATVSAGQRLELVVETRALVPLERRSIPALDGSNKVPSLLGSVQSLDLDTRKTRQVLPFLAVIRKIGG